MGDNHKGWRAGDWLQHRFFPPAPPAATATPPTAVADRETAADVEAEAELRPKTLYDAARDRLNWQDEFLERLTPLHLAVRPDGSDDVPDDDKIVRRLRLHAANLSILYLADWTKRSADGDALVAIFAGTRGRVEVELADPESDQPTVSGTEVATLIDLVRWTYGRSFGGDRLTLVQNTVARALAGCPAASCFERLLRQATGLREEIKTGWKLFMEGRLEEFMGQVRALEDEVASTAQAYSDQTAAMIKSLSDTALGAIAVVLGTFIAAMVKEGFSSAILIFGAVLYALYLITFPLLYSMRQRHESYRELEARFERRRRAFKKRLTPEKVDEIVGTQVEDSQRRFKGWFLITGASYLLVVLAVALTLFLGRYFLVDLPPAETPPAAPPVSSGPDV